MGRDCIYICFLDFISPSEVNGDIFVLMDNGNQEFIQTFDLVSEGGINVDDLTNIIINADFFVNRYLDLGALFFRNGSYQNPRYDIRSNFSSSYVLGYSYFYDVSSLSNLFTVPPVVKTLDGDGCEFLDGDVVFAVGRPDVVYQVRRSYHALYADNAYVVMYDLESSDGHKLTCPESLVTRYVAPVTTP